MSDCRLDVRTVATIRYSRVIAMIRAVTFVRELQAAGEEGFRRPNPPLRTFPSEGRTDERGRCIAARHACLPFLEVEDDIKPAVTVDILVEGVVGLCASGAETHSAPVHAQGIEQIGREQRDTNQLIAVRVHPVVELTGIPLRRRARVAGARLRRTAR
jgi:hypothetical protein